MNSEWYSTNNKYIRWRCELTEDSFDQLENTEVLTVQVYVERTNSGYETYGTGSCTVTIDGTEYTQKITSSQKITEDGIYIFSQTLTVEHDDDGSKTLEIGLSITHSRFTASTQTYEATLTDIARASNFTVTGDMELGTSSTITISPASDDFVHTLTWECGSQNGTIGTAQTSTTTFSETFAVSLASEETAQTYVTISISCTAYTYDSDAGEYTQLGTITQDFNYTIPDSVAPTCSITLTDTVLDYGIFVQNKSNIEISVTPTLAYDSPIASYSITALGKTYDTDTVETGILTDTGTYTISASVTDERGRTGSTSTTFAIITYSAPQISTLSYIRTNSSGVEQFDGDYIEVTFAASATSLEDESGTAQNSVTYSLSYSCTTSGASGSGSFDMSAYDDNFSISDTIFDAEEFVDSSYTFLLTMTAADNFTTTTKSVEITTGFALFHWSVDGRSMASGKIVEHEGEYEIAMPTRVSGGFVYIPLDSDADFDDTTTTGWYTGEAPSSYSNCPFDSGSFLLEVQSVGTSGELLQICTSDDESYEQKMRRIYTDSGGWSDWVDAMHAAVTPVEKGGTGVSSVSSGAVLIGNETDAMYEASGSGALYSYEDESTSEQVTGFGVLPISAGGTGATDAETARANLGIDSESESISAENGKIVIGEVMIQWGYVSTSAMSSGKRSMTVTFDTEFGENPRVIMTPLCASAGSSGYIISGWVYSVSTTEFTAYVGTNSSTATTKVGMRWVAFGIV